MMLEMVTGEERGMMAPHLEFIKLDGPWKYIVGSRMCFLRYGVEFIDSKSYILTMYPPLSRLD